MANGKEETEARQPSCCQRCFMWWTGQKVSQLIRDYIVHTAAFEAIILISILVNCITTAIEASSYVPVGQTLSAVEIVFTIIFTLEILLKWAAWGFWGSKSRKDAQKEEDAGKDIWDMGERRGRVGASLWTKLGGLCGGCSGGGDWGDGTSDVAFAGYFGSGSEAAWNWLDFWIVILSSYLTLILSGSGANLTPIRALRVLRPLRTIRWIPQLRALVETILTSMSQLLQVFVLMFFIFLIFAVMGIDLFVDAWFYNGDVSCQGENNNCDSVIGFQNFFYSLLTVFQIVSLEGWSAIQTWLYERGYPFTWPFFVAIIIGCSFYAMNLVLSVIVIVYQKISAQVQNDARKEAQLSEVENMLTQRKAGKRNIVRPQTEAAQGAALDDIRADMELVDQMDARDETEAVVAKAREDAGGEMRKEKIRGTKNMLEEFRKQLSQSNIEMANMDDDNEMTGGDDSDEEKDMEYGTLEKTMSIREVREAKTRDTHNKTTAQRILSMATPPKSDWVEKWKDADNCFGRFIIVCNKIAVSVMFDRFIVSCIILNMITLCLVWYPKNWDVVCALNNVNIVFTAIFAIEMIIKLIGLGVGGYVSDGFNIFDGTIVVVSILELIIAAALIGDQECGPAQDENSIGGAFTALRIFRIMRVLRIFRVYGKLKPLRQILNSVTNAFAGVIYLFVLLLLFMFVFGVMGVTLYKNKAVRRSIPIFDKQFQAHARLMCKTQLNNHQYIVEDDNFEDWALECSDRYSGLKGGAKPLLGKSQAEAPGPDNLMQQYAGHLQALGALYSIDSESGVSTWSGDWAANKETGSWDKALRGMELDAGKRPAGHDDTLGRKGAVADVEACLVTMCVAKHSGQYFENFGLSFVTVFQVMTGDNWYAVMQSATQGSQDGFHALFFVAALVIGKYVILNLFIAIILAKMADEDDWKFLAQDLAEKAREYLDKIPEFGSPKPDGQPFDQRDYEDHKEIMVEQLEKDICAARDARREQVRENQQKRVGKKKKSHEEESSFAASVARITDSEYFEWFMTFIIVLSCGFLAYESPMLVPNSDEYWFLFGCDVFFAIVFIVEMVLRIIADGWWTSEEECGGPKAGYFQDWWNILDFLVVIFSVVALVPTGSEVTNVLRALRAIRPIRLAIRVPQIRVVFEAILNALTSLMYTLIFITIFWMICAIIGLNLYTGTFGYCQLQQHDLISAKIFTDSGDIAMADICPGTCTLNNEANAAASMNACTATTAMVATVKHDGVWTYTQVGPKDKQTDICELGGGVSKNQCIAFNHRQTTCTGAGVPARPEDGWTKEGCEKTAGAVFDATQAENNTYSWVSPRFNFDHIGISTWTVFKLSTMSSWYQEMYRGWYSTGIDSAPVLDSAGGAPVFFIMVVLFGGFFTLNIVIAVVIDSFNKTKSDTDSSSLMTESQAASVRTRRLRDRIPLERLDAPCPSNNLRQGCWSIGRASWFETTITVIILVNTFIMCLRWYNQDDSLDGLDPPGVWRILDYVFVAIYTLEAMIKLSGFGFYHYFSDAWNTFDFVVVAFGWIGFIIDWSGAETGINLSVVRLFRVLRILRIVKRAKVLRTLFLTLSYAAPSIWNVGMLVFIIFYIWGVFGVKTFGVRGAAAGYVIPRTCMDGSPTYGEVFNFDAFGNALLVLLRAATYDEWESTYCWMAAQNEAGSIIYFLTFHFLGTLFMLNLFIAVMLDTLRDNTTVEDNLDTMEELGVTGFRDAWAERDALRKGQLPADKLREILKSEKCGRLVGAILAKTGLRKDAMEREETWKEYEQELKQYNDAMAMGDENYEHPGDAPKWDYDNFYGSAPREDDNKVAVTDKHIDEIIESRDLPLLLRKTAPDGLLEQWRVGYGESLYAFMQILCVKGHAPEPIKSRPMLQQHLTDWHKADPDKQRG